MSRATHVPLGPPALHDCVWRQLVQTSRGPAVQIVDDPAARQLEWLALESLSTGAVETVEGWARRVVESLDEVDPGDPSARQSDV